MSFRKPAVPHVRSKKSQSWLNTYYTEQERIQKEQSERKRREQRELVENNSRIIHFNNSHRTEPDLLFDPLKAENEIIHLKIFDFRWFMYKGFRYECDWQDPEIRSNEVWSFDYHTDTAGAMFYTAHMVMVFHRSAQT
jgi:hypothetical protein